MSIQNIKTIIKVNGILSIIGVIFTVIALVVSLTAVATGGGAGSRYLAGRFWN